MTYVSIGAVYVRRPSSARRLHHRAPVVVVRRASCVVRRRRQRCRLYSDQAAVLDRYLWATASSVRLCRTSALSHSGVCFLGGYTVFFSSWHVYRKEDQAHAARAQQRKQRSVNLLVNSLHLPVRSSILGTCASNIK